MVETDGNDILLTVAKEKWNKAKRILESLDETLTANPNGKVSRKQLEKDRGFLNYMVQMYEFMTPYLMEYHLTIDSWRSGRDGEGWRVKETDSHHGLASVEVQREEERYAPSQVTPVSRLVNDVRALQKLITGEEPLRVRAQPRQSARALYGFGDASRAGFGASVTTPDGVLVEYGSWSREVRESSSSNWSELGNLVEVIWKLLEDGTLANTELFIFTDNSTAEAAFSKGSSKSRKLFELVLALKELQTKHSLFLHIIHVSGKRMIAQGTDGLSRADKLTGVMAGRHMLEFVPLHLSAVERSARLRKELEKRVLSPTIKRLEPSEWYEHAGHSKVSIWTPPPAAADVVAEQITKARHKRPHLMSIVILPCLFTGRWRCKLSRATDGNWTLHVNHLWNLKDCFEPLLLFVALPYRLDSPQFGKRHALLEELDRVLSGQDLLEKAAVERWNFLWEFLSRSWDV